MSVTIKDVAAKAGVAISTVSLALRDSHRLKAETRARVQRVALELGYRRNPAFAALGSRPERRKSGAGGLPIAIVFQCASGLRDAPWPPTHAGVLAKAGTMGYDLNVFHFDQFKNPAQLQRILYARGVAGVILEYFEDPARILEVDWSPFSVVACGAYGTPLPFDMVRVSNFIAARTTFGKVWDRGYRRIGVVAMHHEPPFFDDWGRVGGALSAEVELRGHIGPIPPLTCSFREHAKVVPWFDQHRPDAVVAFPPYLIDDLRAARVRVPGDVAYAAMVVDDTIPVDVAGAVQLCDDQGRAAVEMLDFNIRMGIRGVVRDPRIQIVGCAWRDGASLPSIP